MDTYLLIEDLPDCPKEPLDLAGEQERNMRAIIGDELWDRLTELEVKND